MAHKIFKNNLYIFLLFVVICCFCAQKTSADLLPQIFVTNLNIIDIGTNEISGEFTIWNNDKFYFSDLNYEIKLFQGTDPNKLHLIDIKNVTDFFAVAPGKTLDQSFTYQFPKNIPDGDYTFRVQAMISSGSELGWKDKIVSLNGENKFLNIDYSASRVWFNNKEYFPGEGVNVLPGENVVAILEISNPGNQLTVIPNIKIFERQTNSTVVKEYQESPISFLSKETKNIRLTMPKFEEPKSYLAEVSFYQNGEQVSGTVYFRWVVTGPGGTILYIESEKDYFTSGENINLSVASVGPADLSNIGDGTLKVSIYDKNGNIVGQASKNISLNSSVASTEITIVSTKDLVSPKIYAQIVKNENVLDEHTINLPVLSNGAKEMEDKQTDGKNFNILLIFLIIISLIILIAVFLLFKRKK
jgi:hypothetical protein